MKILAVLSTSALLALSSQSGLANVDVPKAKNLEQVESTRQMPRYTYESMKVQFDENSSSIDADSKRKLRDKIITLQRGNALDQITVAAFSDQPYPAAPDKKLSSRDSDLADKRISSVESAFDDLEGMTVDVETFNLAEDPNTFEKWFNTADYKLKTALKNNMVVNADTPRNLRLIKDKGEEGSAIVVFRKRVVPATAYDEEVVSPAEVDSYNEELSEKRTEIYSE